MAVADATSASGAIATSPARRTRAVRGLTLTTPAQFRLAAAVLVVGLAVLGLVGVQVALDRADAVTAVTDDATPMLVGAEELYVALADADAAASSAFLGALEPRDLRAKYRTRIAEANAWLTKIAAEPDLSVASSAAVTRIAETLPAYTGEIEAARANDRWGFPVGAAHLRQASNDMVATILPAATSVYEDAARQLYDALRRRHVTRPSPGSGGRRCHGAGPPAGDAGRGDVADQAAPQRGAARRNGAGGRTRYVDAGQDRRAGLRAGPLSAGGL